QRRAATGVAGVKQEIFEIHRDELQRAGQLVRIWTACDLGIVRLAFTAGANPLRPAGEVQQARIIAQGKAAVDLAAAWLGQADQTEAARALAAESHCPGIGRRPEARAIVKV